MSHESYEEPTTDSTAVVEEESPAYSSNESVLARHQAALERAKSHTPSQGAVLNDAVPRRFRDRFPDGIAWGVTAWIWAMHVGAIAAFWHFSWSGIAITLALHFVTACLGVTLGYHRLLTHGSFVVPNALKYFFSICGTLSAEGSPLAWVATHRKHHVHSDDDHDPHSPNHGFWWAHMFWFHPATTPAALDAFLKRWAPDLYKDPVQQFLHKTFGFYPVALGVILYAAGEYFFGLGTSWVLWGLCMRTVIAYHSTWFVNSATHMWGYRNYTTTDRSTNLWWVALLSYGEGWHNNHHAHQRLAVHGHRWWEVDVTYMVIRFLRTVGLAARVQDRIPEHEMKK